MILEFYSVNRDEFVWCCEFTDIALSIHAHVPTTRTHAMLALASGHVDKGTGEAQKLF